MPFFSVIIATRNRPALFQQALQSVLAQSWQDAEIIVINDGSTAEHQPAYEAIVSRVDPGRLRSLSLVRRPKGHGQSYAVNVGAAMANAPYLCFLDDDDYWTDESHLRRAEAVISGSSAVVDLYMTNQAAFRQGEPQPGPVWLENLPTFLAQLGNRPDRHGAHAVTVKDLLCSDGFCHLNNLIVRKRLFDEIGGMDEGIRWECDHDLYLRLIDRATTIRYAPITVSRHNIPDPRMVESMTTALSEVERRLFQLTVFRRAQYLARHPAIRARARRNYGYALKRIAEALAATERQAEAAQFAREALSVSPTVRWAGYTAWLTLRAAVRQPGRRATP